MEAANGAIEHDFHNALGPINGSHSGSSGRSTPNGGDPAPGKLFVGGLSWQTSSEKLREYFGMFGTVTDVLIMKDPVTQVRAPARFATPSIFLFFYILWYKTKPSIRSEGHSHPSIYPFLMIPLALPQYRERCRVLSHLRLFTFEVNLVFFFCKFLYLMYGLRVSFLPLILVFSISFSKRHTSPAVFGGIPFAQSIMI